MVSFGVIHYYPHLLPDVVFVDPQFLLDKISELVKFCYKLRHDPNPHTATQGESQKFKNEGCITLKLLNQFPDQYTNFFTPADFLKLMNDRLIVTHLIDDKEYLMPSLLRTMESREVDLYRMTASGVAPLAIHFSCRWVPHGVFCSLVAFLQSSQNSSPWRLSLWPADPTKPWFLTRNCINFQFPSAPGSVTRILSLWSTRWCTIWSMCSLVSINTANSFVGHSESSRNPQVYPAGSEISFFMQTWEQTTTPCTPNRCIWLLKMWNQPRNSVWSSDKWTQNVER